MRTPRLLESALVAIVVLSSAPRAYADDPPSRYRGFAGGAALASVQPERFATRTDLRGAADETRAGALLFGGITLPKRLAVQGEVGFSGRLEDRDRDEGRDHNEDSRNRVDWRDGLASVVLRWQAASVGAVSFEPVGGFSVAFARETGRRTSGKDNGDAVHDRDGDARAVEATRGGVVAGMDVGVSVARHVSIVPTFRVHRLARDRRSDDETPNLGDGSNVYRFGVGMRWTF